VSIKVYNAYRLSKRIGLGDFIREIQPKATESAHRILRRDVWNYGEAVLRTESFAADLEKRLTAQKIEREEAIRIMKHQHGTDRMLAEYRESTEERRRSAFNYDAGLTFRWLNGYWYMQVFAQDAMRGIFDFVIENPRVVDYHYQNSTDRPEEVTARDWRQRKKVWDTLYAGPCGRMTFLELTVMNFEEFRVWTYLDAMRVTEEIYAKYRVKP
jgi:hypothetical protein